MATSIGKLLFSSMAVLFALFGLGIFRFGRMMTVPVHAMEAEEATPVADLIPGETAEVHGTVRPADEGTVETPLYEREAVEVVTKVQRSTDGGDAIRGWYTYHEDRASVPFLVADDTGSVRIEPPDVVDPNIRMEWERFGAGADGDLSEPARTYLSGIDAADLDAGIDVGPLSLGSRQRCGEGCVEPGDEIHVFGRVVETEHGWCETTVTITIEEQETPFVYTTNDPETVERTTSRLGLAISGFGVLWMLFTLLGGFLPWIAG